MGVTHPAPVHVAPAPDAAKWARLRLAAWASLVANIAIVVTGGVVRLTGSGLGCPTWPRCTEEAFTPHQALDIHSAIEFGNRLITFVLAAVAILTIVAAYRVPTAALLMQRRIDARPELTAANPSLEIARLLSYARPLGIALTGLGLLLAAIAAAGATVGLLAAMNARTRDLALLRALGARRIDLATVALCEAAAIAGGAVLIGVLLAVSGFAIARDWLVEQTGLLLEPDLALSDATLLAGGAIVVTLVAAAFPALRAIHADIEELLRS